MSKLTKEQKKNIQNDQDFMVERIHEVVSKLKEDYKDHELDDFVEEVESLIFDLNVDIRDLKDKLTYDLSVYDEKRLESLIDTKEYFIEKLKGLFK